jgi:hypothetical protein
MARRVIVAGIAAGVAALTFGSAQTAKAQFDPVDLWAAGNFAVTFSIGPILGDYRASYRSTGNQTPESGSADTTAASLCGGLTYYVPINRRSRIEIGGGINFCGETTGEVTLFYVIKHGLTGRVRGTVDPGVRVEPFIGVHIPLNNGGGPFDYALFRMGPVFAENKLSIVSDQVPGGGQLESASRSGWVTGFGITGGLSTKLCAACMWGVPLSAKLLAKAAWFWESQSVSVTSRQFGFTETATLDRSTQVSILANFSVPLGTRTAQASDARLKRDVVKVGRLDNGLSLYRYRYLWSDQVYVGVMAQEVALLRPQAVVRGHDGYLRVDYAMLGARMMTWEEWAAAR